MNSRSLRFMLVTLAGIVAMLIAPSALQADIAVPEPQTVWARNAQPTNQSIAYAGVLLSAAIITTGLIVARWPARGSKVGLMATGAATAVGVLAVAAVAWGAMQQAERDRAAWEQWEIDESHRRANWRGPPQFDGPPEPSPPPPTDATASPPEATAP
jgi:hypothetical protein